MDRMEYGSNSSTAPSLSMTQYVNDFVTSMRNRDVVCAHMRRPCIIRHKPVLLDVVFSYAVRLFCLFLADCGRSRMCVDYRKLNPVLIGIFQLTA